MGFKSVGGTQCNVRFACPKGFVECNANVVDDETITFDSPSFEKYGTNISVEGRCSVGGRSLTNSSVDFTYFAVTSCETTVMFGPACLDKCLSAPFPNSFFIQARDFSGANRTCGFDEFTVEIYEVISPQAVEEGGKGKETKSKLDLQPTIIDQEDGTYKVEFSYPKAGKYEVIVKFEGTFKGTAGHIRGSPYQVNVADGNADGADAITNDINGPLVMMHIKKQISATSEYASKSLSSLKRHPPKDDLEALIKVKEVLRDTEEQCTKRELGNDVTLATLQVSLI
jgi:hypothetical protein